MPSAHQEQVISDWRFRRILGGIVEKTLGVCWLEQETREGDRRVV